jgi:F420-dependent oxidoreductase-like protein
MQLRIFTEPQQGAEYGRLLAVARAAEELGFDAFFRSDHYLKMGAGSGLPGPTDSWVTLAALARETSRVRLGTLMSAATFRYPGPLAISVAQVDEMSAGRIELGLGTGWFAAEHAAYGIPFPGLAERFDRLEEQLAIITGLWETPAGKTFSFDGSYYALTDSPALPKPVQRPRPPILVGGNGPRRTPRLAARFAGEFNVAFVSPEQTGAAFGRVRDAWPPAAIPPRWSTRPPTRCAAAGPARRWRGGRRRSAERWPSSRSTAWPGRPRRSWTSWACSPPSARPGCTCRSSTCTTWTIWS